MAQSVGPLVDQLLRRVRDPHGTAHARALVRRFLNYAEGFVGVAEQANLESFTFTTDPLRVLYNCKDVDPTMRILAIRSVMWNGKDLVKTPFGMLGGTSMTWFRDIGQDYLTWSPIGRDLFVLYPAMTKAQTVTVVSLTHVPYPYPNDQALTTIEDHRLSETLDFAEALLLLRLRRLDLLKPALKRVMDGIAGELDVDPSLVAAGDTGDDRAKP
jgi:hypothetical protein